MDSASAAKQVLDSMGSKGGGDSAGAEKPPKGVTMGHTAAAERIIEAINDRKPTQLAAALKDFYELCEAESDSGGYGGAGGDGE